MSARRRRGGTLRRVLCTLALALLGACASFPPGPSQLVLPGAQANFDQFRVDEASCRNYAAHALGGGAAASARSSALDSAVTGTAVGAAAGALIGAAAGNPAAGAAIGGGSGLLLGAASGGEAYEVGGARGQSAYDTAYIQCMYARGHQVPVPASAAAVTMPRPVPARATVATYPPPGTPPPPGYR